MAMIKPIGLSVPAFDAANDYTFKFQSIGGNQIVYNQLVIKENDTDEEVYNQKIESYGYAHTVKGDTLTNGKYYYYYFITFDKDNNESPKSDDIPFYCYTTPTVTFDNIPPDRVIEASSFEFSFTYSQKESELLDYLILNLYDATNKLISTSGELYSSNIPPNNFTYQFDGFLNNEVYSVQAVGRTINNTVFESEKVTFSINYYYPSIFNQLDLQNNCEDGYVSIRNNAVLVEGETYPIPSVFLDSEQIVLTGYYDYVDWNRGYSFNDTFILEAWMFPTLMGEVIRLWGNENPDNYLEIELIREIPYGETEFKDSLELNYYENKEKKIYKFTEYIDLLNNLSKIFIWVRKTKTDVELKLEVLERIDNDIILNEVSNAEINRITNIKLSEINIPTLGILRWNEVSDLRYEEKTNLFWNAPPTQWTGTEKIVTAEERNAFYKEYNLPTINHTKIRNGVYDHIYITKNINYPYNTEIPEWDYYTILSAFFHDNINAGNVDFLLNDIQSVKIKRRKLGEFNWITLFEVPVNTYDDLTFIKNDYMCPSGEEFEWAIVPILSGNIEGAYAINSLKTDFNGLFITDNTGTLKLYNGTAYTSNDSNLAIGMLQPYGVKYPKFIFNKTINYETLGISGMLINQDYNGTINRNRLIELQNYTNDFLKNGKPKIFKDWNGRILVCLVSSNITYSYNASYGMGIPTINFQITEQGKYNVQEDLYKNGIIEVVS